MKSHLLELVTGRNMRGPTPHKDLEEERKQWKFSILPSNPEMVKEIVGCVVEVGIKLVFSNFVYMFEGEFFLQAGGGPIGSRITMAAAQLVGEALLERLSDMFRASSRKDVILILNVLYMLMMGENLSTHSPRGPYIPWKKRDLSGRKNKRKERSPEKTEGRSLTENS